MIQVESCYFCCITRFYRFRLASRYDYLTVRTGSKNHIFIDQGLNDNAHSEMKSVWQEPLCCKCMFSFKCKHWVNITCRCLAEYLRYFGFTTLIIKHTLNFKIGHRQKEVKIGREGERAGQRRRKNEWMDEWMNEWMNEWMRGLKLMLCNSNFDSLKSKEIKKENKRNRP